MNAEMKAICLIAKEGVKFQRVPAPVKANPDHVIIKMIACAINPGDQAFINRPLPPGSSISLYNVYGASGAGTIIAVGAGVQEGYIGKKVSSYRSLRSSDSLIGTWCEYSHMPIADCVLLPDNANPDEYSGSLVNIITPYGFLKQVSAEGHKGILSTAGASATGIALAGICQAYNFPLIPIVRNEASKAELEALGATNIVVQNDPAFKQQLQAMAQKEETTAIFDGVGGEILNKIIDLIPNNSTIYSYGYLGGETPLTINTRVLTSKGISIKPFANFKTQTVRDPQQLEKALKEIGELIHMPHFKTKPGKKFRLEQINDALSFSAEKRAKAVLCPWE
jgi:NADPH2:quinone reductase